MKISIIVPRWVGRAYDYYAFPLGLAYISAILKRDSHTVSVLNCNNHSETIDQLIASFILENKPEVVCTGGLSVHFSIIDQLVACVRNTDSAIKIVLGGGVISSEPEVIFEKLKPDFGVIGEGEITISELAGALAGNSSYDAIPGLIYRSASGEIVQTEKRRPVKDLDSLPWPDYEGFEIDKQLEAMLPTDENYLHMHDKPRMLPMISSRSCPYSCSFCFHPLGNQYRERSLDSFFAELDHLVKHYRLNSVMVLDELFAVKRERLHEFCRRIKPYGITWIVQLRVDNVDKEILDLMKDAGCVFISYGIESMCDKILESMQKKTTRMEIEKALKLTIEAGIGIQGNLLFGDSEEDHKTMAESLFWWSDNRRYQINITPIYAYPGTKIYKYACDRGLITDKIKFLENNCPPLNITKLSDSSFSGMIRMVETLHETVNTDGLTSVRNVKLMDEKSPLREDLLIEFDTTCPYCKSELSYRNIPVGKNPMARFTLRMACRKCNSRFDAPLSLRLEMREPEQTGRIICEAEQLASVSRFADALECLYGVLKNYPLHAQANALCGRIMLQTGNIDAALSRLSLAVRINPLVASTQAALATAFSYIRNYTGAALHMREAQRLSVLEDDSEEKQKLRLFKLYVD